MLPKYNTLVLHSPKNSNTPSRDLIVKDQFLCWAFAIHSRMKVLLIFVCFSISTSSCSRFDEVGEITSIVKVWSTGRPFAARWEATGIQLLRVSYHLQLIYSLEAAPLNVSLLTIKAWILGSHPVGPYTSWMGTTSYTSPGRKSDRKEVTLDIRVGRSSRISLLDFLVRRASSVIDSAISFWPEEWSVKMCTCDTYNNLFACDPGGDA